MVLVKQAQSSLSRFASYLTATTMMLIGFFAVIFAALPEIVVPVSSHSGYSNEVLPLPGGGVASADACYSNPTSCGSGCGSCAGSGCDCGSCACGDGDGGDGCG